MNRRTTIILIGLLSVLMVVVVAAGIYFSLRPAVDRESILGKLPPYTDTEYIQGLRPFISERLEGWKVVSVKPFQNGWYIVTYKSSQPDEPYVVYRLLEDKQPAERGFTSYSPFKLSSEQKKKIPQEVLDALPKSPY
ncbi:MAG: hypothetical protein WAW62_02750 [Candidatus Saccharimonas aalborgensis]